MSGWKQVDSSQERYVYNKYIYKGIGAHEPSSIVYDVTGYKMFSLADIGVENHQIASDGGVFANVKAKFKVSTRTRRK